jgi:hypothetical protein
MHLLRSTIQFLAAASLLLAAIQIYLTLNKLWKRKHEPAVADSISIMGEFVGLLPLLFLTMNFTLQGQWEGTVDGVLWLGAGGVSIAIGTGMWVEGRRGKGFFTLLREALALERGEVGDLANRFFHPAGARSILQILAHVALIDDHLDERERNFIQSFVDAWGIDFSPEAFRQGHPGDHLNYRALRSDVEAYLSTSPPPAQVQQLSDVVNALINVDEEVSEEEALVLGELEGMWNAYLTAEADTPLFGVAVVPQSPDQDRAISDIIPNVGKTPAEGGEAYVVGRYHSERYAEVMGRQFRDLGFFTTVVRVGESRGGSPSPPEAS